MIFIYLESTFLNAAHKTIWQAFVREQKSSTILRINSLISLHKKARVRTVSKCMSTVKFIKIIERKTIRTPYFQSLRITDFQIYLITDQYV